MNKNDFLKNLNTNQQKAVTQTTGPILVIAGAGSGKTRVITTRIMHLIANEKIEPSSILALTFTNKAAYEMRERVEKNVSFDSSLDSDFDKTQVLYPSTHFSTRNLAQSSLRTNGWEPKPTSHFSLYQ